MGMIKAWCAMMCTLFCLTFTNGSHFTSAFHVSFRAVEKLAFKVAHLGLFVLVSIGGLREEGGCAMALLALLA